MRALKNSIAKSNLPWGILASGLGLFIILLSLDVIHADDSSFHAPRWVVAAVGLIFSLAGVLLAVSPSRSTTSQEAQSSSITTSDQAGIRFWLGAVVILLFALVFNWVAFGPGEREFQGGITVPFGLFSVEVNETMGRAIFGIGSVMIDVIAAAVLWKWLRRRMLNRVTKG